MPTPTDVAWAAGLFEGEGTWSLQPRGARAAVAMTDRDIVERFAGVMGMGSVRRVVLPDPRRRDMWFWTVGSMCEVRAMIELFRPYLGERRRAKAAEIMVATENWQQGTSKHKTHCKHGHELTEENVYQQPCARSPKGWTRRCRTCMRIRSRAKSSTS